MFILCVDIFFTSIEQMSAVKRLRTIVEESRPNINPPRKAPATLADRGDPPEFTDKVPEGVQKPMPLKFKDLAPKGQVIMGGRTRRRHRRHRKIRRTRK